MNVLGHHDVAEEVELVFAADRFEGVLKDGCGARGDEVRAAAVTTEGDEVKVARLLSTFESRRHQRPRYDLRFDGAVIWDTGVMGRGRE